MFCPVFPGRTCAGDKDTRIKAIEAPAEEGGSDDGASLRMDIYSTRNWSRIRICTCHETVVLLATNQPKKERQKMGDFLPDREGFCGSIDDTFNHRDLMAHYYPYLL